MGIQRNGLGLLRVLKTLWNAQKMFGAFLRVLETHRDARKRLGLF